MTLAEALTQRLPVWERTNQAEPALPSNLPPEILDLARHCLRRDPQLRWTVADISARLQQNSPTPPRQIAQSSQTSFANPRAIGGVVLAVVALAAILGGLLLLRTHSQNPPPASVAAEPSPVQSRVQPSVPAKVQPTTPSTSHLKPENKPALSAMPSLPAQATSQQPPPVAKPVPQHAAPSRQPPLVAKTAPQPAEHSLTKPSNNKLVASNIVPSPAPVRSATPAATSASGVVHGKVVQQILPDAPQKAKDTIRGKVRVSVKVHVNESGTVTEASFAAPGPSPYFADRTLKAAQLWKFTPAKLDGSNVPSDWLLRFEIDPASITVSPAEIAP